MTTFRPPFVHGPRQPFYRELFFWDRLLDGRPIILPEGADAPTQWVSVSDLAEGCVRAIEVHGHECRRRAGGAASASTKRRGVSGSTWARLNASPAAFGA